MTRFFNGATFKDLDQGTGPVILTSATDLSTGSRFQFTQRHFDQICSDMNAVNLSRAAAASSAVPVVLSPVTFNNYGGTCNNKMPAWMIPFADLEHPTRPAARAMRGVLESLDMIHALSGTGVASPLDNAKRIIVFYCEFTFQTKNKLG